MELRAAFRSLLLDADDFGGGFGAAFLAGFAGGFFAIVFFAIVFFGGAAFAFAFGGAAFAFAFGASSVGSKTADAVFLRPGDCERADEKKKRQHQGKDSIGISI